MERFIIDIEHTADETPELHVYVRKVNIDPKGYQLCELHGNSLSSLLNAAVRTIKANVE